MWDAASSRMLEHCTTRGSRDDPPPATATHELLLPAVRTSTPWSAVTISASDQQLCLAAGGTAVRPLVHPQSSHSGIRTL